MDAKGGFIKGCFPTIDTITKEELCREVSIEETLRAPKSMGAYKALGLDDFQSIFFKKTWSKIGEEVHSFVKRMLEDREVLEEAAEPILVLVPKEKSLALYEGFDLSVYAIRPINLHLTW